MRISVAISFLALSFQTPVSARLWTRNDSCPSAIKAFVPQTNHCGELNGRRVDCEESPEPYFLTMASIHEALLHCPDIRSLDVDVSVRGCSEWPDRWNFPLDPNGGETYPVLRELKVRGYHFGNRGEATMMELFFPELRNDNDDSAQPHGMAGSAPPTSNLDLWASAMDWSKIEDFAIDADSVSEEVLEKLPPLLKSLRKLETTDLSLVKALRTNTLTHLTWIGPSEDGDLAKILDRQGFSLRHLEFRCDERSCLPFRTNFNITTLHEKAPNLVHLSINVPRNGTWPLESLQSLVLLPKLRYLEIYSNIQSPCQQQKPSKYASEFWDYLRKHGEDHCVGKDRYQIPLLDSDRAEDLFRSLKQANEGGQLLNMTLRVGDWASTSVHGYAYGDEWMMDRKLEISCSSTSNLDLGKLCELEDSLGHWPPESNCWGEADQLWWEL
jgi:hypothetical protein